MVATALALGGPALGNALQRSSPIMGVVLAPSASQEAKGLVEFLLVGSRLRVGRLESALSPASYEGVDALVLVHDAVTPAMLASLGSCGQAGVAAGVVAHSEGGLVAALPPEFNFQLPISLSLAFGSKEALNTTAAAVPRLGTILVAGATLGGLRAAIGEFVRRTAVASASSLGIGPQQADPRGAADHAVDQPESLCVVHTPPPWFHTVGTAH
jgi:hypothetical protein